MSILVENVPWNPWICYQEFADSFGWLEWEIVACYLSCLEGSSWDQSKDYTHWGKNGGIMII